MKVLIIGGTGLLGSEAARELIRRNHEVISISLPNIPKGAELPSEMQLVSGNYIEMTDKELLSHFAGCEGFIFAAGVDERLEGPHPIYEMYKKYNIDPLYRLLNLAKKSGVKHSVILGSYFSYFAKERKELNLTKYHPYIRSRIDQENMALSFGSPSFDISVLELPYIFGVQKGRKPVWVFLVENIKNMKRRTYWPKGGTTMMTVKQVGEAVVGALELNKGSNAYPIGFYNLTWKELITIFHKYMGCPNKKIVTIPNWIFKIATLIMKKKQIKNGIEGGLDLTKFHKLHCTNQFIDKELGSTKLGVKEDDIDKAIGESVILSLEIIDSKVSDIVSMKGE